MDFLSLICFLCILPLGILLLFGIMVGILYRDRRKHADAWRDLARQGGLTFHPPRGIFGRPTLTGEWHGRAVRVYTRTSGTPGVTGGGSSAYMHVEMAVNLPEKTQFTLLERDFFNQPGSEDIRSGDAEFDQRFVVRGQPPEFVRRLLADSGLRRLLLQARYVNIETVEGNLRYQQFNVETHAETMLFLFALLFDLAEAVERA